MAKQDAQPDGMSTPLGGGAAAGIGSNTAPHLAYHDLRKWLEEAEKLGEVKTVKGLSWQRDIGMLSSDRLGVYAAHVRSLMQDGTPSVGTAAPPVLRNLA